MPHSLKGPSTGTPVEKQLILIVADTEKHGLLASTIMSFPDCSVQQIKADAADVESIKGIMPDMIIIDMQKSVSNAFNLCAELTSDTSLNIPVIFSGALTELHEKEKVFEVGCFDFITQPFSVPEVLIRVKNCLMLRQYQRELENMIHDRTVALQNQKDKFEQEIQQHSKDEAIRYNQFKLLSLSSDIGKALVQGKTIPETLNDCCELIVHHLDAAFARVWLIDDAPDTLTLHASAGMYTRINGDHRYKPISSGNKIGNIALTKSPHITNDIIDDPQILNQEWVKREKMVAFAGHPLLVDDTVIGVVAMFSQKPLSDMVIKSLENIADGIALGVQRKLTESALIESEKLHREAQEIAHIGHWKFNITTDELSWSDELYKIFGISQNSTWPSYDAFLQNVYPEDRDFVAKAYSDSVKNKTQYDIVHRILDQDGRLKYIHERCNTEYDADGAPLWSTGTAQDVTSLHEALEQFSTVLDSLDSLVYVADMDTYEILFINKYGRNIWGDITGKTCWKSMQTDQSGPCDFCTNDRLLGADGLPLAPIVWEIQNTVDNEWYECRDQAIRWLDGRLVRMEIASNVTQRKNEELERTKLEAQLRQSQKIESIGTLAGGIAHDFNNILTAIIGYADLAHEDMNNPESLDQCISQVIDAAERARRLVQQILTFSRKTEQGKHPLRASLVVKEALKLLRSSIPSTIAIKEDIRSEALVLADPTQIHQIVMNLCTNAYHAMRETGGTITTVLKEVNLSKNELSKLHVSAGNYLQLTIIDTGTGMDEETKANIFEPYFTTKELGEGTGLGLAVVHGIVTSCGGFIQVDSKINQGTTFSIYLPICDDECVELPSKSEGPVRDGNERIMLVDDELSILEMMTALLTRHGYNVFPFSNAVQASQELEKNPNQYDLLITDMTMPYMTGVQLFLKAMEIQPKLPVILCTGHSEQINREKALVMGINAYCEKPLNSQQLLHTIRKELDKAAVFGLRILLVDDLQFNADLGKHVLEQLGCKVTVMTSGQDAIDLMTMTPDEFDVIITDQNMPNMTGLELAEKSLAIRPDIPILLVTGDNDTFDEELVKLSGISAVLGKPLDESALTAAICTAKTNNICFQI